VKNLAFDTSKISTNARLSMAVQIKKNQSNLLCGRTRLGMTQVVKTCRGACATDVLPTHPCNSKRARRAIKNHRVLYLH